MIVRCVTIHCIGSLRTIVREIELPAKDVKTVERNELTLPFWEPNSDNLRMGLWTKILILSVTLFCFRLPSDHAQDGIEDLIRTLNRPAAPLDTLQNWNSTKAGLCTYQGYCQYFERNALSPYLYKDPNGFEIPNYLLLTIEGEFRECLFDLQKLKNDRVLMRVEELERVFLQNLNSKEKVAYREFNKSLPKITQKDQPLNLSYLLGFLDDESKEDYKDLLAEISKAADYSETDEALSSKWVPLVPDPYLNPYSYEKNSTPADYESKCERVSGIYNSVQGDLLNYLSSMKSEFKEEVENLKARVQRVKLAVPTPGKPLPELCYHPNAYFSHETFTLVVCPQLLNFPPNALRQVLSHELSHAIDPCSSTCTVCSKKSPSPNGSSHLRVLSSGPAGHFQERTDFKEPMIFKKTGLDLVGGDEIVAFSIRMDRNPFLKISECLSSKGSVEARKTDADFIIQQVGSKVTQADQSQTTEQKEVSLRWGSEYIREKSPCRTDESDEYVKGRDQRNEAFAEWMSKELGRIHLTKANSSTQKDNKQKAALEYLFGFAPDCPNVETKVEDYLINLGKKVGCEYEKRDPKELETKRFLDSHPRDKARYERLFLADPEFAAFLGCEKTPDTKDCRL